MSAWMTSNNHISAIVTSAVKLGVILEDEAQNVGMKLWRANTFSLKCRYGDERSSFYRFKYNKVEVDNVTTVKLCHSFDYQSCEYTRYFHSGAAKIIRSVLDRVSADHDSIEYENAPWSI